MRKRILSLLLAVCMIPSLFMFTASASFGDDWRLWSQADSDYAGMRAYGCHVTAQAKLLAEAGIVDPARFKPDDLYDWLVANDYIRASDCYEKYGGDKTGTGMIEYAKSLDRQIERVGVVDLSGMSAEARKNVVWTYILHGCSVILHCSAHQDYISRTDSLGWGTPVISRSVSSPANWEESKLIRAYQGYAQTYVESDFNRAYIFRVGNPDPDNAAHSYEQIGAADPTCTESGSFTYRCSVCGAVKTAAGGAPRGHSWDAGTVTDSGSKTFTHRYTYESVDYVNYYETRHKTCTRCNAETDSTRYYGACGKDATWSLENGVLTISGTGATASYNALYSPNSPARYPPWSEERQPVNEIVIEDGITSIGSEFFCVGAQQAKIVIPDSVTSIGWGAFSGCTTDEFVIGKNVASIGEGNALGYVADKITVAKGNDSFRSLNGVLYTRDLKTLLRAPTGRTGACRIADTTEIIYNSAFKGAQYSQITIPDSVREIGSNAFNGIKNLRAIYIPDSVKSIGSSAFAYTSLVYISVPACTMGYGAFDDNKELSIIVFRDGVTALPEHAVAFCPKLSFVEIPSTLTGIGNYAFICSPVSDVFYTGTEEQWKQIKWGSEIRSDPDGSKIGWGYSNIHYNTTMQPAHSSENIIHGSDGTSYAYSIGNDAVPIGLAAVLSVADNKPTLSDKIMAALADCMSRSYDISLRDEDNNEVQPQNGGMVMVNIPIPEGFGEDCTVYRLESDGTLTNMCATSENGMLQFAVEHFCTFIVAAPCEHEYTSVKVAPTCISQGYTEHTCKVCGREYKDEYVKAAAHDFVNGVCSVCGEKDGSYTPPAKVEFSDVKSGAYYYDAVQWAVANGITNGMGGDIFAPDATCTRGQIVTFLYRAAGEPSVSASVSFKDVNSDAYYYKAVQWAVANGITNGMGGDMFAPDATCTRAQVVTFLYRANHSPAVEAANSFSDVPAGAYYENAVVWATEQGITNGMGNGCFSPDTGCTRGQVVTFLYRAKH